MKENNYITIFNIGAGKDGQSTLRFNNISKLFIGEDQFGIQVLTFEYVSESTGITHSASFNLMNIAGYSLIGELQEIE